MTARVTFDRTARTCTLVVAGEAVEPSRAPRITAEADGAREPGPGGRRRDLGRLFLVMVGIALVRAAATVGVRALLQAHREHLAREASEERQRQKRAEPPGPEVAAPGVTRRADETRERESEAARRLEERQRELREQLARQAAEQRREQERLRETLGPEGMKALQERLPGAPAGAPSR